MANENKKEGENTGKNLFVLIDWDDGFRNDIPISAIQTPRLDFNKYQVGDKVTARLFGMRGVHSGVIAAIDEDRNWLKSHLNGPRPVPSKPKDSTSRPGKGLQNPNPQPANNRGQLKNVKRKLAVPVVCEENEDAAKPNDDSSGECETREDPTSQKRKCVKRLAIDVDILEDSDSETEMIPGTPLKVEKRMKATFDEAQRAKKEASKERREKAKEREQTLSQASLALLGRETPVKSPKSDLPRRSPRCHASSPGSNSTRSLTSRPEKQDGVAVNIKTLENKVDCVLGRMKTIETDVATLRNWFSNFTGCKYCIKKVYRGIYLDLRSRCILVQNSSINTTSGNTSFTAVHAPWGGSEVKKWTLVLPANVKGLEQSPLPFIRPIQAPAMQSPPASLQVTPVGRSQDQPTCNPLPFVPPVQASVMQSPPASLQVTPVGRSQDQPTCNPQDQGEGTSHKVAEVNAESNTGSESDIVYVGEAKYGVTISKEDMLKCQQSAKTPLKFALNLLEFVFTPEEILTSSMKGNAQRKLKAVPDNKRNAIMGQIFSKCPGMTDLEKRQQYEEIMQKMSAKMGKIRDGKYKSIAVQAPKHGTNEDLETKI